MGFDYALVHLIYTIPPAIGLTLIYRPLCTRIDVYKVLFLIIIAVVATTPWDSYLIRRKVWTYPPSVIIGPTFFSIPAEEVFFFVIQTYNTSLLFLLLNKPTLNPCFLIGAGPRGRPGQNQLAWLRQVRTAGQVVLVGAIIFGFGMIWKGSEGTYLGLILSWVAPFALLLWTLAYQFLIGLPYTSTIVPIALPTLHLWIVDTLALRRGTWTIESGTKLGVCVWDGLEIEEAIFFLATNILIVFGLVAFENALAVLEAFPTLFPIFPELPSPLLLVQALLIDPVLYDEERLMGINEAVVRLSKKSRSFYLASSVFPGRLRIDLIILYSFCRVADDLVDDASTESSARAWIERLSGFLDQAYNGKLDSKLLTSLDEFPTSCRSALQNLQTPVLSSKPLYDLLEGFKTDLKFSAGENRGFPIVEEYPDLDTYARQVAGTVAELCIELVFHHCPSASNISPDSRKYIIRSGGRMGIALQCVNIARDIATDAAIGRVYIPTTWLQEEGMSPESLIQECLQEIPDLQVSSRIERLRSRLLTKAFAIYVESKAALDQLPTEARAPMKVAIESYMEIGRVLREKGYQVQNGKATVPKLRRLGVAWKALKQG